MDDWKTISEFPNYEVNSDGEIRNIKTQRIMKTYLDPKKGYIQTCLRKDKQQYTVKAAKLVADTFHGEAPGMDVRYIDNDRSNIHADNLYRSTRKETIIDSFRRGDRRPNHVSPIKVLETGKVYESIVECARDLNCCKNEIHQYLIGNRRHVKGYHFERV